MVNKKVFLLYFGFFIFMSLLIGIHAQEKKFTYVISNSENWQDVYSIIHYANLKDVGSDFLVSTKHGPILLDGINKNNYIRVISSKTKSFVINYDSMIRDKGFKGADEVVVKNANLELINDLPNIKNFIVVGNTYGYNAIAVAPYSILNKSWVFLADRANIGEIDSILSKRKVNSLIIYGSVDRDVRNTLAKYNPEIIDNGDRFVDNIEIVKKYLKMNPINQITLTNGEFIEKEIMSGREPVLFTGKQNVPDEIKNYIKSSNIKVGVLIGADLVGAATNIRRSTGISVIVKFARGARAPTGAISAVEGLDLFYLPVPIMKLDLSSAKYNRATSQLELVYKSDSTIPVFFKGTITPKTDSGEQTRIGDVDPIFIAPNDFKTVVYPDVKFSGTSISLDLFTLYGDTPTSLEKILEKKVNVTTINIIDKCEINIAGVKYSKPEGAFVVNIKNTGAVDCWVDSELSNVIIDKTKKTLGSEGSIKIKSGENGNIIIKQEMIGNDLQENNFVNVIAYYGQREDSLVKIMKGRFELKIELISYATIGLLTIGVIVIIAMIILFFLWKKRRDEDDDF